MNSDPMQAKIIALKEGQERREDSQEDLQSHKM
jgi:hypothetical protein